MTKSSNRPLTYHPIKHSIGPRTPAPQLRPLSPEEVRRVWQAASPRMRRFILIWLMTGERYPVATELAKELPW